MSSTNKAKDEIVGQKIGGSICKSSLIVSNLAIIWMMDGSCKVFEKESVATKALLYKIEGAEIIDVFIPRNHEMMILKTKDKTYIRDFNNQSIQEAEHWADYYFEPITESFYRKDSRGNWYDIEGFKLGAPVFLKDNVLCSLAGKTSRKSMSYQGQDLVISPAAQLIQIGKLVYDINLELVHYFGEKITGLGKKSISFGGEDVLQEIHLGLKTVAFINEYTKQPYLINNEEINGHIQTVVKGKHRFEVFKSTNRKYYVEEKSTDVFSYEGEPVVLNFSTFLEIGQYELILVKVKKKSFFMEINHKVPFSLPGMDEQIMNIDLEVVKIGGLDLFNIKTLSQSFVYIESQHEVFKINDGSIQPESISECLGFESNYAFAMIDGVKKLFYKKTNQLIQLGEEQIEIKEIVSSSDQKLLNAISTNEEEVVLDARKGFDHLVLAMSKEQRVMRVVEKPFSMGNFVLQNVHLQTLGGSENRVIDLNEEDLAVFTLPKDLLEYEEQTTPSSFHGNPILTIDFKNIIKIADESFLLGNFLSFFGDVHPVYLQLKNGKPIHIEGAGHRNELIIGFNPKTISKDYHIGNHRMLGAYTLTEDLKENELMFAMDNKKSWLSFYDSFLPIMKRVVELEDEAGWEYLLFELREMASTIEYLAVERVAPYRVLVHKVKGKPVPKIVKSKEKVLKTPEEISAIKKFFLIDPGYLMEVD